jgi:hypothetical protein
MLCVTIQYLEKSANNKFMIKETTKALKFVGKFLKVIDATDNLDDMLNELDQLGFWEIYKHIFVENFGEYESITNRLIDILYYASFADDNNLFPEFFEIILEKIDQRNWIVLASDNLFTTLGRYSMNSTEVSHLFYSRGVYSRILEILATDEIGYEDPLYALTVFFVHGDINEIEEFTRNEVAMFDVLFELLRDENGSLGSCQNILQIIKKTIEFSNEPNLLISNIQSTNNFMVSLESAHYNYRDKLEDPELIDFLEIMMRK